MSRVGLKTALIAVGKPKGYPLGFSLSKNPDYAAARTGFFECFNPKIRNVWRDKEALHFHFASFFKIHGSKLKLHPVGHLGEASVLRVTHRVFLLRICKDPFYGLFSLGVQRLVFGRVTCVVRQILVILPDMPLHRLDRVHR